MKKINNMSREELIVLCMKQQEQIKKLKNATNRDNYNKEVDDELLRKLYVDKGWSVYKICKETGFKWGTVKGRLEKLGVYVYKV